MSDGTQRPSVPPLAAEDHVCGRCGLAYSDVTVEAAAARISEVPAAARSAVARVPAALRRQRPAPAEWSVVEYLCHLRDVHVTSTIRLHRARTEDRPVLEPMLNDLRARRFRYGERDPAAVLDELDAAVRGLGDEIARVREGQWDRPVTRLRGEERTARWLVRQALHEGVHHLDDIRRTGEALGAADPDPSAGGGYLLDNRQVEAGQRFDALSAMFDGSTFRHLRALGIAPGWRAWEVGAGGPGVPTWLAEQVGPSGQVLATDIDTSWIEREPAGYAVRRHDIGLEPPPEGDFDLVHARLVLVHVPQRAQALATMVAALRPGGWLLLEEADPAMQPLVCPDESGPEQRRANALKRGFRALLAERGVDLAYGRKLPGLLRGAGLVDVRSDAYFPMGGPACSELERATVEQIRDRLVAAGLASTDGIDQHLAAVVAGRLDLATSPMISAWGRRPSSP